MALNFYGDPKIERLLRQIIDSGLVPADTVSISTIRPPIHRGDSGVLTLYRAGTGASVEHTLEPDQWRQLAALPAYRDLYGRDNGGPGD